MKIWHKKKSNFVEKVKAINIMNLFPRMLASSLYAGKIYSKKVVVYLVYLLIYRKNK